MNGDNVLVTTPWSWKKDMSLMMGMVLEDFGESYSKNRQDDGIQAVLEVLISGLKSISTLVPYSGSNHSSYKCRV